MVQYCPDRFRAEKVNVGLILVCENPHTMEVRMAREFSRLRAFFALSELDIDNLMGMLEGLENRILASCVDDFRTMEDLWAFALTLANDLRLTEPRLSKISLAWPGEIETIKSDFESLFADLVETQDKPAMDKGLYFLNPDLVDDPKYKAILERSTEKLGLMEIYTLIEMESILRDQMESKLRDLAYFYMAGK